MPGNGFRLRGRKFFLTYSQTPPHFDPEQIARTFRRVGGRYVISRELHQDGGTHFHCFLIFDEQFHTRDQGRSMLTGLTPILNRYALHLERLTTTPPSLETFASTTFTMTISNQRSNRATGMKSLLVSLENDFSNYCVSGIRACLSQLSRTSRNMQTGPIGLNRTNISPRSNILRSMSGSERNCRVV